MSIRVMSQVWETNLPATEKFVLLSLADYAADDGTGVWPSKQTVAVKCSTSLSTIHRTLRKLEKRKLLIQAAPPGTVHATTLYLIDIDRLAKFTNDSAATPTTTITTNASTTTASKLDNPFALTPTDPARCSGSAAATTPVDNSPDHVKLTPPTMSNRDTDHVDLTPEPSVNHPVEPPELPELPVVAFPSENRLHGLDNPFGEEREALDATPAARSAAPDWFLPDEDEEERQLQEAWQRLHAVLPTHDYDDGTEHVLGRLVRGHGLDAYQLDLVSEAIQHPAVESPARLANHLLRRLGEEGLYRLYDWTGEPL
jgi:Helix-turn-helix domain